MISNFKNLKDIWKNISPILIDSDKTSIKIGISHRFFLFQLLSRIVNVIEEDPHLNFIALLKNYKVLGKFLEGTLHEFHRDRNKAYFKNFFYDSDLYELVKKDLEFFYPKYKNIKMTITKRGVLLYENYKKNVFNVLLLTIHSGTWVPKSIQKKMIISPKERFIEEDIDTHKIYSNLVLDKAGVWIDNKQSRFVVDFNRKPDKAIYKRGSEIWLNVVWKEELTRLEEKAIKASYMEFYFTLARLVETHNFNIIFDGHSMRHQKGRPDISFGTRYIPHFYMPIVLNMQKQIKDIGYKRVALNNPYMGGNILNWLSVQFPNIFICSMEVNKKLYMNRGFLKTNTPNLEKLSKDIAKIFDFEVKHDTRKQTR